MDNIQQMEQPQNASVSFIQDRFGRFIENHPTLMRWLGDLETFVLKEDLDTQEIDCPIFISGLARSGSTILLEILASHPMVVTHRYQDFPFVHLPYAWHWFLKRATKKDYKPVERFHHDGMIITPESPEAMEEVLWMNFFPDCHEPKQSAVMPAETKAPAFERFYTDHIRKMLLSRSGKRYAAKCNYHVSRLLYIKKIFGEVRFVIPVREPKAHIGSLVRQHQRFCKAESDNSKILDYMRRVGHFEFGLDRRPIHLGDTELTEQCLFLWADNKNAEGYACQWSAIYEWILNLLNTDPEMTERVYLLSYEDFCKNPSETLTGLFQFCGLPIDQNQISRHAERIKPHAHSDVFSISEKRFIEEQTRETYHLILDHCQTA